MYKYILLKKARFLVFILILMSPTLLYYGVQKLYSSKSFTHNLNNKTFKSIPNMQYEESISFSSAAFYYFYELGVAAFLQETYDLSKVRFIGSSSGSFISILLACEIPIEKVMKEWIPKVYKILQKETTGVYFNIIEVMRKEGIKLLQKDAYKKASGKATLSLTKVNAWQLISERVSDFSSNQELIDVGFLSAHLPFLANGNLFSTWNGATYIDGGFTDYQPIYDNATIKVSPYMWSYVWCSQSPLWFFSLYGDTSEERNLKLYNDGYQDAKNHPEHWQRLERFRKQPAH